MVIDKSLLMLLIVFVYEIFYIEMITVEKKLKNSLESIVRQFYDVFEIGYLNF